MRHQITRGVFVLTCFHGQTGGVSLDYIAQGVYPNKNDARCVREPCRGDWFPVGAGRLIIGLGWRSETREQQSGVSTTRDSNGVKIGKLAALVDFKRKVHELRLTALGSKLCLVQ